MNRAFWNHYRQVKVIVRERFPAAFPPSGSRPVPLAVGIHRDLKVALEGVVPNAHVGWFLRGWTGRRDYLHAVALRRGRFALDGAQRGTVTNEHRLQALKRLGLNPAVVSLDLWDPVPVEQSIAA